MRGLRYDRILGGTALAMVLALAPGAYAQPDQLEAGVPMPQATPLPPPTAADVDSKDATTTNAVPAAPAEAAPAVETPPDPLASLDPACRPIAQKIRDLYPAKADRIFANRKSAASSRRSTRAAISCRCGWTKASSMRAPRRPSSA